MKDETFIRKNSLRLREFDYAARRAYFITIVVQDRKPIFLNNALSREVIKDLVELRQKLNFNLYVYCLMPDHFHAIIGTGESGKSLGQICGAFKSISNHTYWKFGRGILWQRQFYDHIIRNEDEFFESLEYIKLNPVRKNLVEKSEDWEFTGRVDLLNER